MSSFKSLFAICTNHAQLTNRTDGTTQEIVPGDLIKIILLQSSEITDYHLVKIFNRATRSFGNDLYKCDKTNINQLPDEIGFFFSELTQGDNIAIHLEVPNGKVKVNVRIRNINDISQGTGRFFALEIIETPNLTKQDKRYIRQSYNYNQDGLLTVRGDKLTEILFANQPNIVESPSKIVRSSEYRVFQQPTVIKPGLSLLDVDDEYQINHSHGVVSPTLEQIPMDWTNSPGSYVVTELPDFTKQEENGMNEYARNCYDQTKYVQLPDTARSNCMISLKDIRASSKQESIIKQEQTVPTKKIDGQSKLDQTLHKDNTNKTNQMIFHCLQSKCDSIWSIDHTENTTIIICPMCKIENCFKCQVVHDNMTCEEYHRHKSVHPSGQRAI